MTDREWQRQFRSQLQRPASRAQCVAPERLLAAAEFGAAEDLRLEVLEHVATCPDCRDEYEVARALLQSADPPMPKRSWRPLALAASVTMAAGLAALWQLRPPSAPAMRGGDAVLALYAATVTPTTVQFAWQPTGTGDSYTVEVLSADGDPLLSRVTTDTSLLVPVAALGSGRRTWSVAALAADGTERRSTVQSIDVP